MNCAIRIFPTLWVITLLAFLSGCDDGKALSWTEDVRLPDGTSVVVKRRSEFKAPTEIGQPPAESWYSLDFEHPITGEKVHFEVQLRAGGAEVERTAGQKGLLMQWPITFMLKGRDLYLVTWTHAVFHEFLHCPDPPYQLYKWTNGKWVWTELTEIPLRKFRWSFVNAADEGVRQRIRSSGYRASREGVQQQSTEFDLTGMTRVNYQSSRYCNQVHREWLADKPLVN